MLRLQQLGHRACARNMAHTHWPTVMRPSLNNIPRRNYVIVHRDLQKAKKEPRVKYILYMVAISWVAIWFVSGQVDKKKPKQYMTEREFKEYEESTGIKRRHKLIGPDKASKYRFFVIPYIYNDEQLSKVAESVSQIDPDRQTKVIDPVKLIAQEKEDDGARYSALLHDLDAARKPYPPGLVTAIIKEHIRLLMNTREGTFDTNYIIINYPQTTSEAIKFENDVADVSKCLIMHFDILNELPKHKNDEQVRSIKNVEGYFDSVGKSQTLVSKFDIMDQKFEEIMLGDL
ncbi:uncharacterized protein LODBEIA_P03730 [Lodderomyces beijingensis]|uniref:Altered inheritance of mitochondria protein 36, mitochondrial n=1 Tax=Lodderomyces beijingensis TaxID=1775926 RepID=A0ABP0ZD73_9ASCO